MDNANDNRDVRAKEFDDWAADVLAHEAAKMSMGPEPLDDAAYDLTPVPPAQAVEPGPVADQHDTTTEAIICGPPPIPPAMAAMAADLEAAGFRVAGIFLPGE